MLVARHNQTMYEEFGEALEKVETTGAKLLGVVLTDMRMGGSYGYGRYSRYGRYGRYNRYNRYGYGRYGYSRYGYGYGSYDRRYYLRYDYEYTNKKTDK